MSGLIGYNPQSAGCTATDCGSQQTVSLDGRFGRRCVEHSPWRTLAADGKYHEAFQALRAWLAGGR